MGTSAFTAIPSGSTLATTISYANSNIAALRALVLGGLEGRGASTPNLASRTVDETTVAHNASICTWAAEYGFSGVVVSGGTYVSASGLTATYAAVTAWILQTSSDPDQDRRIVASTSQTVLLTASSDNYVYLKADGTLGASAVSVGAAAPTLPADTILLSIATTDGSTVTGTPVDKRIITGSAVSKHYRSLGAWPVPTTTTNFQLPPGALELEGTLFEQTTATNLDITQSGNFVSGSRTSAVHLYMVAANVSGALRVALTTSAPSAMTIVSGATAGSAGILQYRTISGNAYRYLGSARTSTTGVMKLYSRVGRTVIYNIGLPALSAGTQTSSTAVALAALMPPTARKAMFDFSLTPGGAGAVFLKESSVVGVGCRVVVPSAGNYGMKVEVPTSAANKIMYRVTSGDSLGMELNGYTENLD